MQVIDQSRAVRKFEPAERILLQVTIRQRHHSRQLVHTGQRCKCANQRQLSAPTSLSGAANTGSLSSRKTFCRATPSSPCHARPKKPSSGGQGRICVPDPNIKGAQGGLGRYECVRSTPAPKTTTGNRLRRTSTERRCILLDVGPVGNVPAPSINIQCWVKVRGAFQSEHQVRFDSGESPRRPAIFEPRVLVLQPPPDFVRHRPKSVPLPTRKNQHMDGDASTRM